MNVKALLNPSLVNIGHMIWSLNKHRNQRDEARTKDVVQHLGKECRGSKTRALIAFFVRKSLHLTLKEFARLAKRYISAVSKQVVSIELKLLNDERIAKVVSVINECIKNFQIAKSQA